MRKNLVLRHLRTLYSVVSVNDLTNAQQDRALAEAIKLLATPDAERPAHEGYYKLDLGNGKLFKNQRKYFNELVADTALFTPIQSELMQGLQNLLDEIADQAHDHYGLDTKIDNVVIYNPITAQEEGVDRKLFEAWQEEVREAHTVLGFMEWRQHRVEDGSICRICGEYQGRGWESEGICEECNDRGGAK